MNILDNHCKQFLEKAVKGFEWSCENGHLQVAQWLYSLGEVNIRIDYAFGLVCEKGHLEVAQWLYSLGCINIHDNNEYAFRWSCLNNQLEVAKWLYSLGGVNIHACNNHVYILCYSKVLEWLKKLI